MAECVLATVEDFFSPTGTLPTFLFRELEFSIGGTCFHARGLQLDSGGMGPPARLNRVPETDGFFIVENRYIRSRTRQRANDRAAIENAACAPRDGSPKKGREI